MSEQNKRLQPIELGRKITYGLLTLGLLTELVFLLADRATNGQLSYRASRIMDVTNHWLAMNFPDRSPVTVTGQERIYEGDAFTIDRVFAGSTDNPRKYVTAITNFYREDQMEIVAPPNFRREQALLSGKESFIGPLGPAEGRYNDLLPNGLGDPRAIFPARDSKWKNYGTLSFDGWKFERSMGGLAVTGDQFFPVNSEGLEYAASISDFPFATMSGFITNENAPDFMRTRWTILDNVEELGSSSYAWCGYFYTTRSSFATTETLMPFSVFFASVQSQSKNGRMEMALCDPGQGSGAVFKTTDGQIKYLGAFGNRLHLAPLVLRVFAR